MSVIYYWIIKSVMKNITKISLQITLFLFILSVVFFIIALFWYGNYNSIKNFLENFLIDKNIILLILIWIFSLFIWFFSRFIIWDIFSNIEENNKKLKDHNHYLAHELKTPIAVMSSNLDVLQYWFDENIVKKSKKELQSMTKIIDSLLNLSETIQMNSKKDINLENFLKNYMSFLENWGNITIHNSLFNFWIHTDEALFLRVIKNLIENALKYSLNWKLDIYITKEKLIFSNPIERTLKKEEIQKLLEKFSRNNQRKDWYGLGLCFIQEIIKNLWYKFNLTSEDNNFIVEIIY